MPEISPEIGFFTIVSSIFFILNAAGQLPLFLALLSKFDQKKQIRIITREFLIGLFILLLFTFFGDEILAVLGISRPIIAIAGGILLLLLSLTMIFPKSVDTPVEKLPQEPMIVPLAIPLIAGPGAMTMVMLYSHETGNNFLVAGAVFCAWLVSFAIVLAGSFIKKILGEKGLTAIERLGGMIICLLGVQMFTSGSLLLIDEYFGLRASPKMIQESNTPRN